MRLDLAVVSHLVLDEIVVDGSVVASAALGGPPTYTGVPASLLGLRTAIVSKVGPDLSQELLSALKSYGVCLDFLRRSSKPTTKYQLAYRSGGAGARELRILSLCEKILPEDVEGVSARCFHVSPVANEVPPPTAQAILKADYSFLSVDVQGFARRRLKNGVVSLKKPRGVGGLIRKSNLIKMSEQEVKAWFPQLPPQVAVERLCKLASAIIIVTLGPRGCLLRCGSTFHVPALEVEALNDAGAGDVFAASFIYYVLNKSEDPLWAACFSAAFTSLFLRTRDFARVRREVGEAFERAEVVYENVRKIQ